MTARGPVAIVEDDDDLRASLVQMLSIEGYIPHGFASAEAALARIDAAFEGPVITDVRMPGISGIDLFRRLAAADDTLPVILMTGHGDIDMAVGALKAGAWDFLTKPFDPEAMLAAVGRAAAHRALAIENRRLRAAEAAADDGSPLIGRSPAIARLRETIAVLARADLDLLVEGETGTGKELVARTIHAAAYATRRRKGRFVAIACPSLSNRLVEEELFAGHGAVAQAAGGTLFLDDVDRASPALQSRLIAFVESRTLGTRAGAMPIDCRIIAASGKDGAAAIMPALLYRLAGMRLSIPPLRERAEDVPMLFAHFLSAAATRANLPVPAIDGAVRDALVGGDWPGNVRELASFADRVVLGLTQPGTDATQTTLPERVDAFERAAIVDAVIAAGGDTARAIAALGLPRKTFYYKVARHGIDLAALRRRNP